MNGCVNTQVVN